MRGDSTNPPSLGKVDTAAVQAAAAQFTNQADRDWLLAGHYGRRGNIDPVAALTALKVGVHTAAIRSEAEDTILSAAVRAGRAEELTPWINSLPEKEQSEVHRKLEKWRTTK